jgi:predicted amidohydrolase
LGLTIAAAQSASVPGDVAENLARHVRFAARAAKLGVRLLVFPELSVTGYEPDLAPSCALRADDSRLAPLRDLAGEAGMTVVLGAPLLNPGQKPHIGAIALLPDGSMATYTKQHLHGGEERVFAPGAGGPTLEVEGATVALAICADTTHAEHAAGAAARGANVYAAGVLITGKGYEADATLMRQYALEHGMAVLMANHSAPSGGWVPAGRSAIWAEDGRLVVASPGTEETLVVARKQNGVWEGEVCRA